MRAQDHAQEATPAQQRAPAATRANDTPHVAVGRAVPDSTAGPTGLLSLQRAIGNAAVARLVPTQQQHGDNHSGVPQRHHIQRTTDGDPAGEIVPVIVQPDYASGDQFAIAAILINEKSRHVFITSKDEKDENKGRTRGDKIRDFYLESGVGADRIHVIKKGDTGKELQEVHGKSYAILSESQKKKRESEFKIYVGKATEQVASTFNEGMRRKIRTGWGLQPENNTQNKHDEDVQKWLASKGVRDVGGKRIAILWSRFSGKSKEVHIEHDTSYFGMAQLLAGLGKLDYVLIVGDSAPKNEPGSKSAKYQKISDHYNSKTSPSSEMDTPKEPRKGFNAKVVDLTEFWNATEIKGWSDDSRPRTAQFLLFDYLHRECDAARHLGFRSGNLEAMALMGFTVKYMEEPGSIGGDRMEKWHATTPEGKTAFGGTAPGYERIEVEQPPTRSGRHQVTFTDKERNNAQKHAQWRDEEDSKSAGKQPEGLSRTKGFAEDDLARIDAYLLHGDQGQVPPQ